MSTTPLCERMRIAMDMLGISQAELARRTGMDKSSLSNYLSGKYKPRQTGIYKIANALNVSEAWLMGFDVPMKKEFPDNTENPKYSDDTTHLLAKIRNDKNMVNLLSKYYETDDDVVRRITLYALLFNNKEDKELVDFILKFATLDERKRSLFSDMIKSITGMMD